MGIAAVYLRFSKDGSAEQSTAKSKAGHASVSVDIVYDHGGPGGDVQRSSEDAAEISKAEEAAGFLVRYDTLEEARFRLGALNREIRDDPDGPTAAQLTEMGHLRRELRRLKAAQAETEAVPEFESLESLREAWTQQQREAVPAVLKKGLPE